jgi:plastocyanin
MTPHRRCIGMLLCMAFSCIAVNVCNAAHVSGTDTMTMSKPYRVNITGFAFAPKMLTVPVGATVIWTNRDEEPHVVVSAGALFKSSAALDTGESYGTTFTKPGTYAYYCSIHPMMVGTVIVR